MSDLDKEIIDLSNRDLTELPEFLRKFKNLKRLNLSNNSLSHLPDWLIELDKLEVLDLRNAGLERLCNQFDKLKNLKALYLRDNDLLSVPSELLTMPNLSTVFIGNNRIAEFPSWFFKIENVNIDNNPMVDPPLEVYHRGLDAVKNYFEEREGGTESLNEAKLLIVGEPGSGKTTLMNKILDEDYGVNPFLPSTKGIEIEYFYFETEEKNKFRVNIRDFVGQEIYHATHQFFLTKRSLYILLSDNRAEDTDFNYWLQTIELLSDNSPIIIVQNEKHDRKKDINEQGMRERFKPIRRTIGFNLASNKNKLKVLLNEIKADIVELSHIGTQLPKIWVDIRKVLEKRAKSVPVITELEYLETCAKFGMVEKERAYFLSDYLHDLGVFLHFKDNAILKRWIILKPEWGTEAVYKVLDNEKIIEQKGYFTRKELKNIWSDNFYLDMHEELISLMMKFELCYQLEGSNSLIAAQLLKRFKPLYDWDSETNLLVKYEYAFMPKGIVTRFIVQMHYYIKNQKLVWREGVILERQNTFAEIVENYGLKEIRIRVSGKNKKEFLAIILDTMDKIHSSYTNLKVNKLIPCNCSDCIKANVPYYFKYSELRRFVDAGFTRDRCRESLKEINLISLIDDAFGNNIIYKNKNIIYISFNPVDKYYKNQFEKHLKLLEKTSSVIVFDREKIGVGLDEKKEMRESLDIADVIILLLSANYIDDEWNYSSELTKAIDRAATGTCITIPVILKECNWKMILSSSIKPILYKGKALFSNENLDEALTDAIFNIKASVEDFLSKKRKQIQETLFSEITLRQTQEDKRTLENYLKQDNE